MTIHSSASIRFEVKVEAARVAQLRVLTSSIGFEWR